MLYSVRPTAAGNASVAITMSISGAVAPTSPWLGLIELTSFKPSWVEDVQQSIQSSVTRSSEHVGDGRWLTQDVANAATDFFTVTGDLLPSEPHIYSSRKGDFVAEFSAKHGKLTSIVSPEFVLLFAVVNGTPIERMVDDARKIRGEVSRIMDLLATGAHGEVATGK